MTISSVVGHLDTVEAGLFDEQMPVLAEPTPTAFEQNPAPDHAFG
jgi:hypothetical protein